MPQQDISDVSRSDKAHVCVVAAAIDENCRGVGNDTFYATRLVVVVPSPSCPLSFIPTLAAFSLGLSIATRPRAAYRLRPG